MMASGFQVSTGFEPFVFCMTCALPWSYMAVELLISLAMVQQPFSCTRPMLTHIGTLWFRVLLTSHMHHNQQPQHLVLKVCRQKAVYTVPLPRTSTYVNCAMFSFSTNEN